jgi:hypothetical protein
MIFVHNIKTPANTPSSTPVETVIPIIRGTITLMSVQFPPGVNALAHLKLLWGLYQLFPSNEQGDFATGGETIDWVEDIDILHEPLQLLAVTWNEDTEYDHTISVRIVMQPGAGKTNVSDVVQAVFQQQAGSQA